MNLRSLLTAAVVVAASVTVPAAGASAAGTKDKVITVVHHNTDGRGTDTAMEKALALGKDLDVVAFQEICRSEAKALKTKYAVMFEPRVTHEHCPKPDGTAGKKGIALVSPTRKLTQRKVIDLGTYSTHDFNALCARVGGTGVKNTWVCTTHLALSYGTKGEDGYVNGKVARKKQMKILRREIGGMVNKQKRRVVVTGDFNMEPTDPLFVNWFDAAGTGLWAEADQPDWCPRVACRQMEATTDARAATPDKPARKGRRLDYVFAPTKQVRVGKLRKDLTDSTVEGQGHHVVVASIPFR